MALGPSRCFRRTCAADLSPSRAQCALQVSEKLVDIMQNIHRDCKKAAEEYGTNLAGGANIAAFIKVTPSASTQHWGSQQGQQPSCPPNLAAGLSLQSMQMVCDPCNLRSRP